MQAVRPLCMATCFHFRAGWREGCTGCKPADHLCAFADSIGWWPAALKVTIPRDVTEQQALFEALERGGPRLVETMRMAMAEVIDRLAVAAAKELMPQVAMLKWGDRSNANEPVVAAHRSSPGAQPGAAKEAISLTAV